MQLTKFTLSDSQFANFERWLISHYNHKRHGIDYSIYSPCAVVADKFLGHYWGVRCLNWMDKTFVTKTICSIN